MKRFIFSLFVFVALGSFWKVQPVSAGTDVTVSCTLSTCTATPNVIPLFDESNIWPGYSVTQKITATNTTDQNGQLGMLATEVISTDAQLVALAGKIYLEIHQGTPSGPVVYGGSSTTLQDFYNVGQIDLGLIGPTQTELYFLKATFDPQAGNEYMGAHTTFNLDVGFVFSPVPPVNNAQVLGLSAASGGGDTNGAKAPVCSDTAPSSAPVLLSAVSGAGGQVTLNWTAVAGADHYAVNFGIQSGVYLYGNSNVGNVTTYVVSGLSPGNRYFFQVLGINGCAPGPRSNENSTGGTLLPPGSSVGAPTGFTAQQVLGATTDSTAEATLNDSNGDGSNPEVLGVTACVPWKPFLPLIFLVIQIALSILIYVMKRDPENKVKQGIVIGVVVISTILFYILRNCDCDQPTFLSLLCKWYFIVAILASLLTQFINYSLIEREE
ncbi:MAG: fibronectin type III domain-containing protein [Patescibacteria group bacterium]